MKNLLRSLLFLSFCAGYLFFTQLLFGDDDLVAIKSQTIKIYRFAKTDTLLNKEINYLAYLCFYLSQDSRQYTLKISVDSLKQTRNALLGIENDLKDTRQVTVWIKRADIGSRAPKVYRLYNDTEKIFEIKEKPGDVNLLTLLLSFTISIFCGIYYYYYFRYKNTYRF